MAQIAPFAGIRYNPEVVPDLKVVAAPPYDVLSKDEVVALHESHAKQITHLTRPLSYDHAATLWNEWRNNGTLVIDKPSFYLYIQTYVDPETGTKMPGRKGLIAALTLEGYETGGVLPHENTIAAHRADRLELMKTTHANLESIYGLYSDDTGIAGDTLKAVENDAPVIAEVHDILGSNHKLQPITDPDTIAKLQSALVGQSVLIADGHHRYETALAYRSLHPEESGSGSILITLTSFQDEGLLVLPTHRLIRNVEPSLLTNLNEKLKSAGFIVSEISSETPVLPPGTLGFDILLGSGKIFRALLPEGVNPAELIHGPQSAAWKSLDVTILHSLVLENLLDIPIASLSGTDKVRYTRDAAEAHQKVESGEFQVAFMLTRPTLEAVRAVSASGDRMPQKSTFFYPKLLSGLVMRSLI